MFDMLNYLFISLLLQLRIHFRLSRCYVSSFFIIYLSIHSLILSVFHFRSLRLVLMLSRMYLSDLHVKFFIFLCIFLSLSFFQYAYYILAGSDRSTSFNIKFDISIYLFLYVFHCFYGIACTYPFYTLNSVSVCLFLPLPSSTSTIILFSSRIRTVLFFLI